MMQFSRAQGNIRFASGAKATFVMRVPTIDEWMSGYEGKKFSWDYICG